MTGTIFQAGAPLPRSSGMPASERGALAITFAAIGVILCAPRADQAYSTTVSLAIGTFLAAEFAAVIAFAALPGLATETFAAFAIVMGLYLVPVGALTAQPWQTAMFHRDDGQLRDAPRAGPPDELRHRAVLHTASAIVAGTGAAALSFRLQADAASRAIGERRAGFLPF